MKLFEQTCKVDQKPVRSFDNKAGTLPIIREIVAQSTLSNPELQMALSNELDFLVYIGMSTGNIIRYVRNSGKASEECLAKLLKVSTTVGRKLEKARGKLPVEWHKSLRTVFEG